MKKQAISILIEESITPENAASIIEKNSKTSLLSKTKRKILKKLGFFEIRTISSNNTWQYSCFFKCENKNWHELSIPDFVKLLFDYINEYNNFIHYPNRFELKNIRIE